MTKKLYLSPAIKATVMLEDVILAASKYDAGNNDGDLKDLPGNGGDHEGGDGFDVQSKSSDWE